MNKKLILFCMSMMVFLAGSCSQRKDRPAATESKVTIGLVTEDLSFSTEEGVGVDHHVFLPMGYEGLEGWQPVLAERYERSDDYREWKFFMRNDIQWHDGAPTTAHDVKFTFDLLTSPDVGDWRHRDFTIEVIDDYCLIIRYKDPTQYPWYQTFYPKHILEMLDPKEFWDWEFWRQPVGNGPYRYVRYMKGMMAELEVNPDFFGRKPKIERVVFKLLRQPSLAELLSGNIDVLPYVDRNMLFMLPKNTKLCSYHFWVSAFDSLYWNHKNPFFEDVEIRKALTLAINREELAALVNYPEGVPLLDAVVTKRQFEKKQYPEPLPFDPQKAQELLEAIGWSDSDGDGIRERNGKKFQFTAIARGSLDSRISVYVQSQFRKIGIRMEIQNMDRANFHERLDSGQFEAMFGLISNGLLNEWAGHLRMFGRNAPSGYYDSEISDLLDEAATTIDPEKLDNLYLKIQQILVRDIPATFLLPIVNTSIVDCRIKGLSSPDRADPLGELTSLWIEDENP
jgi:peptide/nickel transport system substrate-binding protein